ncbi:MAG: phospholipid/glycerol acyltransferase [Acidimicrobiales bacterium]|nr:phospholipid/glycerol acyltransferase [Acidimicrobiales bacterium]
MMPLVAEREVGQLYPVAKAVITPLFRFSWRFHVEGIEHVPATGGAILCPNHTSVLDSFFLPAVLPRRMTYVGKAEYMDDWKTKHLFPALGMIPIDRGGGDASERALSAAQRILEAGELFGIYPEGTRSRVGTLHRGHTGPARLALRCGVPIIPVGIRGAREVMPPEARFPKLFRPVGITFGRPIDVGRYAERANDRMVLRQITDEVMYEIRELSGQEYVDEYATKKKPAPPADPVTTNGDAPPAAEEPSTNGHEAHEHIGLRAYADLEDATAPRSSADVLRRPATRR